MNTSRRRSMAIIVASLLLTSFSLSHEKQKDGILFELRKLKSTDPQWLKIQVCSEDIIRVIASPEKSFSSRPSLIVDKNSWNSVKWTMKVNKTKTQEITLPKETFNITINDESAIIRVKENELNVSDYNLEKEKDILEKEITKLQQKQEKEQKPAPKTRK